MLDRHQPCSIYLFNCQRSVCINTKCAGTDTFDSALVICSIGIEQVTARNLDRSPSSQACPASQALQAFNHPRSLCAQTVAHGSTRALSHSQPRIQSKEGHGRRGAANVFQHLADPFTPGIADALSTCFTVLIMSAARVALSCTHSECSSWLTLIAPSVSLQLVPSPRLEDQLDRRRRFKLMGVRLLFSERALAALP